MSGSLFDLGSGLLRHSRGHPQGLRGPTLVGGGVIVDDDDELGALDGIQGGVVHPPAEVPLPHERPLRPPLRRPRSAGGGMGPMGMGHGGGATDPAPSPPPPSFSG